MSTTKPRRTLDELARLGEEIFDRKVRPALRPQHDGKFVAIDVEAGDYELDEDDYADVARLQSRKPTAEIGKAVLADGSVRQFDICAAEVEWGGSVARFWCTNSETRR